MAGPGQAPAGQPSLGQDDRSGDLPASRTSQRAFACRSGCHQGIRSLRRHDRAVLGLSDAGAHASQLCDACFSTYLLEHWVRATGVLTLEHAVHRLTGHVAEVFRIEGRGRVAPGYAADLVAFDLDTVG